jgi:hypothetical protein
MIATHDLRTTYYAGDVPFDPHAALERIYRILLTVVHRLKSTNLPFYYRDHAVWRMKVTPFGIKEFRLLAPHEVQALNSGDGERRTGIIPERLVSLMQREWF